ncbi:MAG: hypothetical protein KatS3mg053_1249 [Candidatus Roseilinea sp.]|nr:MAG: hypothetical protein KatS3mg053_1249 [Candidatus Roseilinea sp.]
MTDDESLLRAILENRDDDTPRLIYADRLEAQGDPRGAFIRLQCASAQKEMALVDPRYWDLHLRGFTLGVKGPRVHETVCPVIPVRPNSIIPRREIELGRAYVVKWLEQFGVGDASLAPYFSLTFFRGFAAGLRVSPEAIKLKGLHSEIAKVFAIPTLERLEAFLVSDGAGRELADMMQWGQFRALHICGPGPVNWYHDPTSLPIDQTIRQMASAPGARALTYLKMSRCWIGLEAFEMLVNSPNLDNLRVLALEGFMHQWDAAGGLPDYYRVIGRQHLQVLLDSRVAGWLTSLSLQDHNFSEEVELLASASRLTNLRCLDLCGNKVKPWQEQALRERWGQDLFLLSDKSKENEGFMKTFAQRYQYSHFYEYDFDCVRRKRDRNSMGWRDDGMPTCRSEGVGSAQPRIYANDAQPT